jgi:predicted transport protein
MTLKAYYDNIEAKTGKTPQDLKVLAAKKGLLKEGVKTSQIVTWLKEDYGLGQGHAMAIVLALRSETEPKLSQAEQFAKHFAGDRSGWRKPYDGLMRKVGEFGPDISVAPTDSYISILRKGKKFAVVAVTADRLDIGIKLKGVPVSDRLEQAGSWNGMVTHRVRIDDPKQIDGKVVSWLQEAYEKAGVRTGASTHK